MGIEQRFDAGCVAASQDTSDGFRRVYVRVAKANHPYSYFNADGTKRIEVIKTDDLFSPSSVASAKMIPATIGHPGYKLDSSNSGGLIHGAVGENFVRETTNNGEFLGVTATLFTDESKRRADSSPGVSPGYSVQLDRADSDNRFHQKNRVYNHLAVGVIPRGGEEVRAMFEGLRFDSEDSSPLWIARFDEECYQAPIDEDFIGQVLSHRSDRSDPLLQRSPVDLSSHVRHDEGCGCAKCADKEEKEDTRGQGFEKRPPKNRKKRMDTTEVRLDEITYKDIPVAFAQTVLPRLTRNDKAAEKLESAQSQMATTESDLEQAMARIDELEATIMDLLEEAEGRTDSEDEFTEVRFTEDEAVGLAKAISQTVNQIREDGALLVSRGLVEKFNNDFDFVADNLGDLQGEMLAIANPRMSDRLDSMEPDEIASAYEIAFDMLRDAANYNSDSTTQRSSILSVGRNLRYDGAAKAMTAKQKAEEELKRQNAAFDNSSAVAAMPASGRHAYKVTV